MSEEGKWKEPEKKKPHLRRMRNEEAGTKRKVRDFLETFELSSPTFPEVVVTLKSPACMVATSIS